MMNRILELPLDFSRRIAVGASGEENCGLLELLAGMPRLECRPGEARETPVLLDSERENCVPVTHSFRWTDCRFDAGRIVQAFREPCREQAARGAAMRLMLNCGYVLELLKGQTPFALFHGALLETAAGDGVLLFGTSEVGKTTSLNRWLAEGGRGTADDEVLVFRQGEEFFCRPLPTWSRCMLEGWDARQYPVAQAVRLRRLLWLTRGERKQEIVPAAPAAWHTHLLSALVLHLYGPLRLFPAPVKRQAGEINWRFIEALDRKFAPRTLKAHLQYPLHETLEMEP